MKWMKRDLSLLQVYIGMQALSVVLSVVLGEKGGSPISRVVYSYSYPWLWMTTMSLSALAQILAPMTGKYRWRMHANNLDFFVWGGILGGSMQTGIFGPIALSSTAAMCTILFMMYNIRAQYRSETHASKRTDSSIGHTDAGHVGAG